MTPDILRFPVRDPIRELRDYCAARCDRLEAALGYVAAHAEAPEPALRRQPAAVLPYRRP